MIKLYCNFQLDNNTTPSEIYLEQKQDDCSVIADVLPCQIIPNLTSSNYYLESILDSSELLLSKSSVSLFKEETHLSIQENSQVIQVKIPHAKLKAKSYPDPDKKVAIQFYLTNIPYSFQEYNTNIEEQEQQNYQENFEEINITGQPKILIKPYTAGIINHVFEVKEVVVSDLQNIIDLIDSICWLISFASGCMSSIARIEVLQDDKLVHLEYFSPENTTLNKGNKVIYREEDVIQFIESTYTYYTSSVDIYKLKKLINLGILAKHTPYIENKILLICNFLEILRYNYAISIGHFIQKNDNFYWADRRNSDRLTFNKIL